MRPLFPGIFILLFSTTFFQCTTPEIETPIEPKGAVVEQSTSVRFDLPEGAVDWPEAEVLNFISTNAPTADFQTDAGLPDCTCELYFVATTPQTRGYQLAPLIGYYVVFPQDLFLMQGLYGFDQCNFDIRCKWMANRDAIRA